MSDHPLSLIPASDAERVYGTITSAFEHDPIARWLWETDEEYFERFPAFVASAAQRAFETSTAWRGDDLDTVALWLSPGEEVDAERVGRVMLETVPKRKHEELFGLLEQMEKAHPAYPHWYLPWIGVEQTKQDHGRGSNLLAACLEYIDRGGLPIFLETSSPRSVPFFERHGFEVTGHAEVGPIPLQTFMIRKGARA